MKTSSSLSALVMGLFIAGAIPAFSQTAETPPADAGAGAAAAVSGNAAASTTDAPKPDATVVATEEEAFVKEENGKMVLPNGMDLTPDYEESGRWYNADGIPVPNIEEDGTVDFATFSGFRRYNSECHVCHGPDGEGSTYAPALKDSVLRLDYYDYQQIVASGKQNVSTSSNQVMPAFGTNKNVWCYVDDIYVYLVAHGTEMIPRGRPAKHADKPDAFAEQEDSCMSG